MGEYILCEVKEKIATLTINRPKALNALNREVLDALNETLDVLEKDPSIRAVILTGSGEKAFVAGADIAEMSGLDSAGAMAFSQWGQKVMERLSSLRPVVIAAVNGFALGGGLELALACDIRVASENAKMGIPEVSLGVIPGFGGTQRLSRVVGLGRAMELMATARRVDAAEALAIGLVNHVVKQEELAAFCQDLAKQILKNSGSAIALGKQAMIQGTEMDLAKGLVYEAGLFGLTFADSDQKEGMGAFLEKRPAAFR